MGNYDYVISMGAACFVATELNELKLRNMSSPFDWLIGGNFSERADILVNKFERFIEFEDLVEIHGSFVSKHFKAYYNVRTGIRFLHDFNKISSLEESWQGVNEKYKRRIDRLLEILDKSNRILMIYMEPPIDSNLPCENQSIIDSFEKISNRFEAELKLVYFSQNSKSQSKIEKSILNDKVLKITTDYKNGSEIEWRVNRSILQEVLKGVKCINSIDSGSKLHFPDDFITCKVSMVSNIKKAQEFILKEDNEGRIYFSQELEISTHFKWLLLEFSHMLLDIDGLSIEFFDSKGDSFKCKSYFSNEVKKIAHRRYYNRAAQVLYKNNFSDIKKIIIRGEVLRRNIRINSKWMNLNIVKKIIMRYVRKLP